MTCKHCGLEITQGAKFCPNCGKEIETSETIKTVEENVNTEIEETTANEQVSNNEQVYAEEVKEIKEEVPVVKEKKAKKEKKANNTKKEKKALRTILSVLCCILIFVFTISSMTVLVLRGSIAPDNVSDIIDEIDEDVMGEVVCTTLLADWNIKSKDMGEIYKEGTFDEFIEDEVSDYAEYILSGEKPKRLDGDDIVSLLKENEEVLYEVTEISIPEGYYDKLDEYFEEEGKDTLNLLSADTPYSGAIETARGILSIFMIVILFVLLALFIFLLFLVRKGRYDSLLWCGIPIIAASLIFALVGMLKSVISGLLSGFNYMVVEIAEVFLSSIFGRILLTGLIGAAVGVILILVYVIIKAVKKAIAKKATA